MSSASPRRRQLLEAALHVIADEGLRGLTHRAVDRRAGLPEGTCSAYLRTRSALQGALTEYVADALLSDVDRLAEQLRLDCEFEQESVDAALSLFLRWLDQRELLVARLELSMAATRDPELARLLADHRARLVTLVEGIMATTGKPDVRHRAETLVASYDGVLLAALLRSPAERPEFLARSLELIGEQLSSEAPAPSEA
ncbi:TetR/AcrR family transcriptional regulator [Nocardioides sp. T2.26MG-1]|uniref:TetR/AcrR family transcriptional regulator n=1 Tax=Nocardioides sp. T2.26MG-1 TaxID=3041166 RepID=UPI0024773312|nr:TetR/AcrR family transcriptional regulator [Nocardioides sp. T2.26MG-1]CAI9408525.1 HTH-type transcriptional regulator BetI [Nocardioides sp. T2.26MG-1]